MLGDIISALGNVGSSLLSNAQSERSARHGIRWRVADARAAGIHPLAALGAQIQPVPSQPLLGDTGLAALSRIGNQDTELARRQSEAQVRLTEAQTMETMARSRSIANEARQPAGSVSGTPIRMGPHMGTVAPTARWSDAQRIQDRYGDLIENIYGFGPLAADTGDAILQGRRSRRMMRISRYIRGGRRARNPNALSRWWRGAQEVHGRAQRRW